MNWFRSLPLGSKLLALPILFSVGFIAFGLMAQRTLEEAKVLGPNYERVVENKDLLADVLPPPNYLVETYLTAFRMASATSKAERAALVAHFWELKRDYQARMQVWQKRIEPGDLRDLITEKSHRPAEEMFAIIEGELLPALDRGDPSAVEKSFERLRAPYAAHRDAVNQIVKVATERAAATERDVGALVIRRSLTEVATGVGLLATTIALSLWLRSQAVAQARREREASEELVRLGQETAERDRATAEAMRVKATVILDAVHAASRGDLTVDLKMDADDTLGQVAHGIQRLIDSLRANISAIAASARKLGAASEELASVSEQLGTSANETSTQAQGASAASEEVSQTLASVSTGTEELSAAIREIAKSAGEAAHIAVSAVEVAGRSNTMIGKLGESSAEIGAVIKVITTIAQQTNLLALNATIEAARAGESGKGFVVVANEVKELAKATATATSDIGRMIETIQGDTKGVVAAIGEVSKTINQISDLQTTIASAVEEQTATTKEMSRIVAEGARGANDIAASVLAVAHTAGDTRSGVARSRNAAVTLAQMGHELQAMVDGFVVERRADVAPGPRRSLPPEARKGSGRSIPPPYLKVAS